MSDQEYAYAGIKSCGCVVMAAVDDPRFKADTAAAVQEAIADGLTVERVTLEWLDKNFGYRCNEHRYKQAAMSLEVEGA